ncbi:hypothetical protein CERZMDRAFT_93790 [Cercospora zeae-maydis SCOH1-5]|uniref:ABC transporter domain-containing protein n=1 Tax=Cercospora zeae-maydis SCOH1-5 TaxID=717836 RepID=A0A6A6FT84_9PEZI|nr:hypothetical protein CERZMDRAFT_93790 [Cercospora zeae-maydis SCOH1-5]
MTLSPQSKEGAVSVYTETSDPQSDTGSANFSTKVWLKSLMAIVGEDPAKFPRRVGGVAFQKLSVHAIGAGSNRQSTFLNQLSGVLDALRRLLGQRRLTRTQILRNLNGLANSGEMLLVLGSPWRRAIAGQLATLEFGKETYMNYQGTEREMMHEEFRGECIYQGEIDVHFPQLTAPQNSGPELVPEVFAARIKEVTLQAFDLTRTVNTQVGNDFVRGVSGGERKRVSIAEAAISGCPVQCWDNSTRGLDSATALGFVQTLRSLTELTGATALVSPYQVSEPIYNVFDLVTVLYLGQQVYFGTTANAKRYFKDLGFECLPRQTTADFITSVTNPVERRVRPGFEGKTPRNADDFAAMWQKSPDFALLTREIDEFDHIYPLGGPSHERFKLARNALQSKSQRSSSPYILSFRAQVTLCMRRGYQQLRSDAGITITSIAFNSIMALVVGSVFFNLPNDTNALYSRGALLFFAILLAAFASMLEILTLYAQRLSALLRQPPSIPRVEKIAHVEEVIKILEMESYADAAIGVPGEGLNIEQRKRLTIGVELAAKPTLLLFLDEPTSGLDSQTAWSIVNVLRKLANNGQTILCTLHQPSAELFQTFDRLLYLAMEGKPVYFGDIGPASTIVTGYFEKYGARTCGADENPAEYILEVTGGSSPNGSWPEVWNASKERQAVKQELVRLKKDLEVRPSEAALEFDQDAFRPYAAALGQQLLLVLHRNFQQYWRTPSYLHSKIALSLCSTFFIGFSFWKTPNSLQGLQNQLFAVFLLLSVFPNLSNQIMPHMLIRRQLYEARERSAKTYSWQAFVMADALVEVPWNCLMGVIMFCAWYYPIGLQQNAEVAGQVVERGGLMFLFILAFMLYVGTFTSMTLAGVDSAEAAGMITNLLFSFSLIFCGVLATPEALPGFWIFMYRVSPFTYIVSGMLSAGLANAPLVCAPEEYLRFAPPRQVNCSDYLAPYIAEKTGYLTVDSMSSMVECVFCTGSETNTFLKSAFTSSVPLSTKLVGFLHPFEELFFHYLAKVTKKQPSTKPDPSHNFTVTWKQLHLSSSGGSNSPSALDLQCITFRAKQDDDSSFQNIRPAVSLIQKLPAGFPTEVPASATSLLPLKTETILPAGVSAGLEASATSPSEPAFWTKSGTVKISPYRKDLPDSPVTTGICEYDKLLFHLRIDQLALQFHEAIHVDLLELREAFARLSLL